MKTLSYLLILFILFIMHGHRSYAGEILTVAAVGDIMMGTDFPDDMLPPNKGEGIFKNVRDELQGNDIVFGNLEGPLIDGGTPAKCSEPGEHCYEFRTPVSFARHLGNAGFNVLNIANNHAFDFGLEGVLSTVNTLGSLGICAVGGMETAFFDVKGRKVTVIGFSFVSSPFSYTISDIPGAMELVREHKKSSSVLIVSFHGGAEGKDALHITGEDESYLGEERGNVVSFAHSVVDAGADMVIGHGPHVLRALEVYKGKLIAYSLGNFLTYERFNISGPNGLSVILKASLEPETNDFMEGELVPVRLIGGGIPEIDPKGKAIELLRTLTEVDVASQNINITPNGILKVFENKTDKREETKP